MRFERLKIKLLSDFVKFIFVYILIYWLVGMYRVRLKYCDFCL